MSGPTPQQLMDRHAQLTRTMGNERRRERSLKSRELATSGMSGFGEAPGNTGPINNVLHSKLSKLLPPDLLPGNVGDIEYSQWGYYNSFDFDFGLNPVLNSTFTQTQSIQVPQDAAFLLTNIVCTFDVYSNVGALGPWQMTITDAQSRRQINYPAIPMQHFGQKSRPTKLLVPMIFFPNSIMQVTVNTWLPPGVSIVTAGGEASFEVVFYGIRCFTTAMQASE